MSYTPRTFTFPQIEGISTELLQLHIGLYEGYVKHVNLLNTELEKLGSEEAHTYAAQELRKRLGFEWNGMRLHELYFEQIAAGADAADAQSSLTTALSAQFGSFEAWLASFAKLSARGPGWALLTYDPVASVFHHVWVADHEIGHLAGLPVLLALDHWEHAYLKDYAPSEKGSYVAVYLRAVNWSLVGARFDALR